MILLPFLCALSVSVFAYPKSFSLCSLPPGGRSVARRVRSFFCCSYNAACPPCPLFCPPWQEAISVTFRLSIIFVFLFCPPRRVFDIYPRRIDSSVKKCEKSLRNREENSRKRERASRKCEETSRRINRKRRKVHEKCQKCEPSRPLASWKRGWRSAENAPTAGWLVMS